MLTLYKLASVRSSLNEHVCVCEVERVQSMKHAKWQNMQWLTSTVQAGGHS